MLFLQSVQWVNWTDIMDSQFSVRNNSVVGDWFYNRALLLSSNITNFSNVLMASLVLKKYNGLKGWWYQSLIGINNKGHSWKSPHLNHIYTTHTYIYTQTHWSSLCKESKLRLVHLFHYIGSYYFNIQATFNNLINPNLIHIMLTILKLLECCQC